MSRRIIQNIVSMGLSFGVLVSGASLATATEEAPDTADQEFTAPDKSIAFYVGGDLTEDGHPMLGGFGHEPSSHWVEVVPEQEHPEGSTITVGATEEADLPGELTEIPQVEETYRYITSNYSEFAGFPAPLTNGGLNEKNVAARDVWSDSREELVDMTPDGQTGPQYSDLSRIAMERASTAEEAVEILGDLIDEHGYTTYGGNSHLFADENEGWVFVEFAGGEGLWAAERLGSDDIRVSYPGYIQDFPTDAVDGEHEDYRGSANLVEFAESQGWYDPEEDETFNLQDVYLQDFPTDDFEPNEVADADDEAPYRNPISLANEIATLGDSITLEDMMRLVRDPRWSDDRSGYGQVAQLRDDLPDPRLATLWLAPTASATAPYIPISIGTEELPVEYGQHRYLTADAASTYLAPEFMEQEATEYATQTFKRLMYGTCSRPEAHLGTVTSAFEGFDAESLDDWDEVLDEAADLVADGEDPADVLTEYTNQRALEGLQLGNHLLDRVLAESREGGGISVPDVDVEEGVTASQRSHSMALDGVSSRDRVNCDLGGGWAEGNTIQRAGEYGSPGDVPDYSAATISGHPEFGDNNTSLGPWAWGVGGLILGAIVVGIVMFARSKKAGSVSSTN